jgi:poly-gamma-glutamate synthesis protein (capsule biosynthesis protein)
MLLVAAAWCAAHENSWAQSAAASPARISPRGAVQIMFVGDILMEAPWRQPPPPPGELFAKVRDVLAAADITLGNLESPLTDWPEQTRHKNPKSVAAGRDFILRTSAPDAAQALADAGFDVAALANNHTMDYTERGLLDTLDRLHAAGITAVGGGKNLSEAESVRIVEASGLRFGFVSFSDVVPAYYWAQDDRPGIASSKENPRVEAAIRTARPQVDFLTVVFHWGEQLSRRPTSRQKTLARMAATAGADLILGAHPHVLQGIGCVGRTPVIYSAGNFVFPSSRLASQRTAILEILVELTTSSGSGNSRNTYQVRIRPRPAIGDENGVVRMAEPALAELILGEIRRFSSGLGAKFEGPVATCGSGKPRLQPK